MLGVRLLRRKGSLSACLAESRRGMIISTKTILNLRGRHQKHLVTIQHFVHLPARSGTGNHARSSRIPCRRKGSRTPCTTLPALAYDNLRRPHRSRERDDPQMRREIRSSLSFSEAMALADCDGGEGVSRMISSSWSPSARRTARRTEAGLKRSPAPTASLAQPSVGRSAWCVPFYRKSTISPS